MESKKENGFLARAVRFFKAFKEKIKSNAAKKKELRKNERLPKICIVFYGIAVLSLILYFIMRKSTAFSDFFNAHIASFFRALLAHLTNWYPASLGETIILSLPVIAGILIYVAVKHFCVSWRSVLNYFLIIISAASLIFSSFVFTFASGYNGETIDKRLMIDRKDVDANELAETYSWLLECVKNDADSIYFSHEGFSYMPYTKAEMAKKLVAAYDKVCDKYPCIQRLDSTVKPVMVSEPWSYTHITGMYTYFTGEANINDNFPDYTIPYTAAHEMAHQRGISREDEANLVAFIVCENSDDPYIRYSGMINMATYVGNALYAADKDLYSEMYSGLLVSVRNEQRAYREFFKKYEHNTVATISNRVNETTIKWQGSRSYGMVVDLAVAYYKKAVMNNG